METKRKTIEGIDDPQAVTEKIMGTVFPFEGQTTLGKQYEISEKRERVREIVFIYYCQFTKVYTGLKVDKMKLERELKEMAEQLQGWRDRAGKEQSI